MGSGGGIEKMEYFKQCIQKQIDERPDSPGPRTPEKHTIGDFIGAVFAVETEDEARRFHASYLKYLEANPCEGHTPAQVASSNIGWCFGEGMSDKQIGMWVSASGAVHPVFGRIMPTALMTGLVETPHP